MSRTIDPHTAPLPGGRLADLATDAPVCVLGFGISNRPLVHILRRLTPHLTVYDSRTPEELGEEALEAQMAGVRFTTDPQAAMEPPPALIFRTPGIRPDHPAILSAVAQGAELTSEMAWFLEITPATVLGITGSDGKTTTSTLTAKMLEAAGKTVYLGGNIGQPLLPLAPLMTADDFAVVELSSFQLMDLPPHCVPHRAVLTNVTPNHLNWHPDMREYTLAKTHIYAGKRCERLVTNADNETTAALAAAEVGTRQVITFSTRQDLSQGRSLCLKDGHITLRQDGGDTPLLSLDDIRLPGEHNVQNYMSALGLVHDLLPPDAIRTVATTFGGVAHRLEAVRQRRGVTYYNSSIDSTPARTTAALSALTQPVVAICGGYDKGIDFAPLADALCTRVRAVVLTGATADKIYRAILSCPVYDEHLLTVVREPDFEKAVLAASALANPGDAVLLSPACASFDAFPNFEVRGHTFTRIVNNMEE
ncbi:MAG: UDP-N-acetylmuramoyl-L-alanine--D-glutamate ligase [Ruminococcaceae bacterium]|nr:UDP-N-acetylmuramoyl-L-alanine--D-glutamate ligase [Oscillospiraceae bacterium]